MLKVQFMSVVAVGVWVLLCATSPVAASTFITLQDGTSPVPGRPTWYGTYDSLLDAHHGGDWNAGGSATTRIRYDGGWSDCNIVKFNLAGQIPTDVRIISSTLSLWYADEENSMYNNNALSIQPWRVKTGKSWTENIYSGYNGTGHEHGVNFQYRNDTGGVQSDPWYNNTCWNDATNDNNQIRKIKDDNGSVPDAIDEQNWVDWSVTNSVTKWYNGTEENNGLLLIGTAMEGSGSDLWGIFTARNDTIYNYRPKLAINYNVRPLAEADGGYTVNPGGSCNLNGTGSTDSDGSVTGWNWDLDLDGQYDDASGAQPSVTYNYLVNTLHLSQGMHTIRLQVADSDGDNCLSPDTAQLEIVPEPATLGMLLVSGLVLLRRKR